MSDFVKRIVGYVTAGLMGLAGIIIIALAAVGFLPLLAFSLLWFAKPMTWESEFDADTKRLLKGTK